MRQRSLAAVLAPLVVAALLVFAVTTRWDHHVAGPAQIKLVFKTDRWTGQTWMVGPEKESPIDPSPTYAWALRNTLGVAANVLLTVSILAALKASVTHRREEAPRGDADRTGS